MTSVLDLISAFALAVRMLAVDPSLPPDVAIAHARAAQAAATARVPAELLLGVAYVESRYDPTATSRVENGIRRTGSYPKLTPPAGLDRHASLYCGPLQTYAGSWRECLSERDLEVAYAAGVRELSQWLRDSRVRGNITLALAGHGCGNAGVLTGHCNGYPMRVLATARRIAAPPPVPVVSSAPRPRPAS